MIKHKKICKFSPVLEKDCPICKNIKKKGECKCFCHDGYLTKYCNICKEKHNPAHKPMQKKKKLGKPSHVIGKHGAIVFVTSKVDVCAECGRPVIRKVKKDVYWMVNTRGTICQAPKSGKKAEDRKKFGNYFKTIDIAIEAKRRMIKLFEKLI